MRIAWFTPRYFPCIAGAENYGRAMVRRFVATGHEVDVLTSDALDLWYFFNRKRSRVEAPGEEWVDGARVRRFPVRHVPLQRYAGRLLSYTPDWPAKCRWQSYMPILPGIEQVRGDYDLVFGVGFPFTIFSFAAWRTASAAGAPLVLTPFLHLATPGDRVHRAYTQPHQIRLLAQADLIISPTEHEALAVSSWGIPRSRVLKLPMAIEPSDVTGGDRNHLRECLGIGGEPPVVGQLGALHPNKGTHDLVRALMQLNASRPSAAPIHLLLAGASSPEWEAFSATIPADARRWLHDLGNLPQTEVPHFYAALDVFAMPSRTDSFGIVFLEAWANGKPVVAAAAGGVPEVVEHEKTGLLIPFGDANALAQVIQSLLDDPAKRKRLGQAGKARVTHGYSWNDRFATLLSRAFALVQPRQSQAA
ncbi:MAG TPA: glycosyltransferase family 4 protein [Isosphaeraceae bacterium]|nr:glycosyltransferase family 4 protein [Isosphaeraceae bacterium]